MVRHALATGYLATAHRMPLRMTIVVWRRRLLVMVRRWRLVQALVRHVRCLRLVVEVSWGRMLLWGEITKIWKGRSSRRTVVHVWVTGSGRHVHVTRQRWIVAGLSAELPWSLHRWR